VGAGTGGGLARRDCVGGVGEELAQGLAAVEQLRQDSPARVGGHANPAATAPAADALASDTATAADAGAVDGQGEVRERARAGRLRGRRSVEREAAEQPRDGATAHDLLDVRRLACQVGESAGCALDEWLVWSR